VGTNAITSVTSLTLGGAQETNYTATGASGSVIVNPLAVVLTGTRPFDATATAAASILSVTDAVSNDIVNVASGSATLLGPGMGVQPIIGASSLVLGGAQATDYTVAGASGTVTITNPPADELIITSASLDITGTNLVFSWQSVPGVTYTVLTNNIMNPMQNWS